MSRPAYKELEKRVKELEKVDADHKKVLEELKEQNESYFALFDYNPIETIAVDREGKITNFNLTKRESGDRLPEIGDVLYKDYAGRHKIDMYAELMKCIKTNKVKEFPELYYGDKTLTVKISPFSRGAVITSLAITERKKTEEALSRLESERTAILNSMSELVIYYNNKNLKIEWANRVAGESVNLLSEKLAGRHCYEIWHDRNTPCENCPVVKSFETGKVQEAEMTSPDGRVWYVKGYPILRADREIEGVVEVVQNITECKRAEEALEESEEIFSLFMEHNPIYVFFKDENIRSIRLSKNYEKMLGKSLDELLGKTMDELFPSDFAKSMIADDLRVLNEGKSITVEEEFNRRLYETIKFPILIKGKPRYLAGYTTDITERKKAEENLNRALAWHEAVFEGSRDAIFVSDSDSKFTAVNKAACDLTGYSREELLNMSIPDLHEAAGLDAYKRFHGRIMAGEEMISEAEILRKDGSKVNVEFNNQKIIIGNKPYMHTDARDITERKRAEEALKASENRYKTLFNAITSYVYTATIENGKPAKTSHGPRCIKITGYTSKEFERDPYLWFNMVHEEDRNLVENQVARVLSGESVQPLEYRIIQKNDIIRWICDTMVPNYDDMGKLISYDGIIEDITKRKQAEEELKESEEKYRTLVEINPHVIFQLDDKGIITFISHRIGEISGHKPDEITGKNITEIVLDDDLEKVKLINEKRTGDRAVRRLELRLIGKDVEARYVGINATGVYENGYVGDGRIESRGKAARFIGTHGTITDITELKLMEQELSKAGKLESIGILAGGIAHDFNNILTVIGLNISTTKKMEGLSKESISALDSAEDAVYRAVGLTDQLFSFARGGLPVKKITGIKDLLSDSVRFALSGSNVQCEFTIPDTLWNARVDRGQISQVISNLIINANHAMPGGGTIEVYADNVAIDHKKAIPLKKDKYVKITVKDHGAGIPADHLEKIFDPYFTTKQAGSGLGLTTAYSIIKNHDGLITVESEPGVGSTFSVYIPAAMRKLSGKKIKAKKIITIPYKILLMDDDKEILSSLKFSLYLADFEVSCTRDGAGVISAYRRALQSGNPFDAVILDLTIPGGMGGKETIKKLLKVDPQVKAIVISGYSDDPVVAHYKDYGFKNAHKKPVKTEELINSLQKIISKKK
ncbi:PAS domain S-box protein [candidate division KSB1 bacterium]